MAKFFKGKGEIVVYFAVNKTCSKLLLCVVALLALVPGCGVRKPLTVEQKPIIQRESHSSHAITVFVHGTRLFPRVALQEQLFSAEGMIKISELDESYKTVHMIAHELSRLDPKRFCYENFYSFGWPGELSFDARRQTAQNLYLELQKLVDTYEKEHGVCPKLQLIAHSHGVNVVLLLAAAKTEQNQLSIDTLILLAGPVQEETKHLINDTMFCKKYVLSSMADLIQIIDPQGLQCSNTGHLFSERWFPCYPGVTQAKIKINGRAILHVEFLTQRFIRRLPEILDIMDSWYEIAKATSNQIQNQPFPLIDLRPKSIRVSSWRRRVE